MDLPEGNYSYRNIAVNIIGWHLEPTTDQILDCLFDYDDQDPVAHEDDYTYQRDIHEHDADCYYWWHDFTVTDFLEVCWIGDDVVHVVEFDELVRISDDDNICSCGQINCFDSF